MKDNIEMIPRMYYELTYKGRVYATVYKEDDIQIPFYNMVHDCNIDPNDIIIKGYFNGREVKTEAI